MKLTTEQLRFFKREGYLILRGVMDPELMARARERLWDDPPASLKREDPATWVGSLPEADRSDDSANMKREYRWQYRRIGGEGWIVRMLAADRVIFGVAEQILGAGRVQIPHGIRGIYCTLPYGDRPRPENGCHCDAHPFHLGVVGYIDDVEPDGGAFCVWPGSHREFYRTFTTGYMPDKTGEYEPLRERLNRQPPVDCHGSAGPVLAPPPRAHGRPQLLGPHPAGGALRLPAHRSRGGPGVAAAAGHVAGLVEGAERSRAVGRRARPSALAGAALQAA